MHVNSMLSTYVKMLKVSTIIALALIIYYGYVPILEVYPPHSFKDMMLRALDHCTSSTLIGGKGGAGPSSLHGTLDGLTE